MSISLHTLVISDFAQNCRVILDDAGGEAWVVDPGADESRIVTCLKSLAGLKSVRILLTHAHLDHAGAVKRLLYKLQAEKISNTLVHAHRLDEEVRRTIAQSAALFGIRPGVYEDCPEPDVFLEDGDKLKIGTLEFRVLFTPGHSPGHVSLFAENAQLLLKSWEEQRSDINFSGSLLIGGDLIFSGSVGRTDLPGGSHQVLLSSIRNKILTLPPDTLVLCGHGGNTTVGKEKQSNPFLQ